jgi:hypothetical protein
MRVLPTHPPAIEADISARLEAMRRAYGAASNKDERTRLVLGALYLCGTVRPLPAWVFKALKVGLEAKMPKQPDLHGGRRLLVRWLLVREGKLKREGQHKKLTWEQAYGYARDQAVGTPWKGSARTMKASYQIYEATRRGRKRERLR